MSSKQAQDETRLSFLERQALEDSQRWFGDVANSHSLSHHVLALCGEAGELANVVKKIERGSLDQRSAATMMMLNMETVDVFTYTLNIAGLLGLDLDKGNQYTRAANEKRFMKERAAREALRNGTPQR
jgi:NTP pyrophosphatase (non-canonical NTP hydrolase)